MMLPGLKQVESIDVIGLTYRFYPSLFFNSRTWDQKLGLDLVSLDIQAGHDQDIF